MGVVFRVCGDDTHPTSGVMRCMLQAWLVTFLASVATLLVNVLELSKSSLDQISQWVNYGNLTAIALRMVGAIAKLIYIKFFNPSDVGTVNSPNSDDQLFTTASRQLSNV